MLISALQESKRMASRLVTEQKVAVKSTLALVKKEKRTTFTSAFSVAYTVRYGLVIRIPDSHQSGPGLIPSNKPRQ